MSFDGNPFDMATIIVAFFTCFIRPIRKFFTKKQPVMSFQEFGLDFLNGTVVVPFILLIGSIFSKDLLEEAIRSNKLFFAIGGVIALLFVLKEYMRDY